MNREPLFDLNNGKLLNFMDPVYDEHGLVLYYQRSDSCYDKGTELYDRNGDFVRYKNSDNLEEYNRGAYALDGHDKLFDGKADAEHQIQDRLLPPPWGESYLLENSWISSDKTPNDPFEEELTEGQPDLLKRLPGRNLHCRRAGSTIRKRIHESISCRSDGRGRGNSKKCQHLGRYDQGIF